MSTPVRAACHRSREGCPRSPTAATDSRSVPHAESGGGDYAARDAGEIAARFPIPSAELAARLVDLLLPRRPVRPKGDEAA